MSTDIEINSPKRLRHLKLVGIVVLLAAAGVVTTGIFTRVHAKQEMTTWSDEQAIPTVAAYTPSLQGATQSLILPGHLSAFVNAPIYARVPGYLHAWYADIGTHVKTGQLLGLIDTPDLDQQLLQAKADLDNAQANEKLAASTAKRWTEMLKQDSVSQQDTDEKTSDLTAKLATVACFVVAYGKVNLIGHSFMELHGAPKGLRIAFAGFTVFVGTVLIVLYLAKA